MDTENDQPIKEPGSTEDRRDRGFVSLSEVAARIVRRATARKWSHWGRDARLRRIIPKGDVK